MYIPEIEKAGRAEIRRFQESQLPTLLNYLKVNSPFYSQFFKLHGIDVNNIKTMEDLASIPVTTKDM
jgi:phenylacetate-CoA ligase